MTEAINNARIDVAAIAGMGITNQHETPSPRIKIAASPSITRLYGSQGTRPAFADPLRLEGAEDLVRERSGPLIDAYFLATKLKWMFENVVGVRERAQRGRTKQHSMRAALESIAYQTCDVLGGMQVDAGLRIAEIRADGGAITNDFLAQFQADMLNVDLLRPQVSETTALGAAYLAGLVVGFGRAGNSCFSVLLY